MGLLAKRHAVNFSAWRAVTRRRLRRQGIDCRITASDVPPRFLAWPRVRITGPRPSSGTLTVAFGDGVLLGELVVIELGGGDGRLEIGAHTRVGDHVHIRLWNGGSVRFGSECDVRSGVVIRACAPMEVGSNVLLSHRMMFHVAAGVEIGDGSALGEHATIADTDHTWSADNIYRAPTVPGKVVIGDNVLVTANCVIMRGVHLPAHVIVGAGSVVRAGDWRSGTLIAGNPATERRMLGEAG